MIRAILNRLRTDTALSALLGATAGDSHIHPLSVPYGGTQVAYTARPIIGGAVRLSSVEFRIASDSYANSVAVRDRITALLDIEEGESGFCYDGVSVMSSTLAGGGELELDGADVYEQFVNFSVKWR